MNLENRLKDPYYKNLTRKMIFLVIAVSFTPMLLVGISILNRFNIFYTEKVNAHLSELVLKHTQNIDGFLLEKLNNIRFIANSYSIGELKKEKFLRNKLAALQTEYGTVFEDLGIINDKGVQVTYAGSFRLENALYSDTEWFKKAIKQQYFISNVFLGLRGTPHFIVTVREIHHGKPWILRATINFAAFNSVVENLRVGRSGFAFIINKDGEFQSKPSFKINYGKSHSCALSMTEKEKTKDGVYFSKFYDDSGTFVLHVGAFLKKSEWILVFQQDESDAFAEMNKAKQIAFIIILIGGISTIITAILLSRWMVARIAKSDAEKEIMNQQVIDSSKLASLGELAAGIAHEINNPVAIMVEEAGWIHDLLEDEPISNIENREEFERALAQIKSQGIRCREITQKLLSFARKIDSRIADVNINELIEDIIRFCSQRAKYSNVAIHANIGQNLPILKVSHTEIQQVILNIMNNALDALEKRGGNIYVSSMLENDNIVIEVRDDGPGIPAANISRIFDPFFTTKAVGKGTGLGLSICYGIIKKLGGSIDVNSTIDAGTTFIVRIPLKTN
jgi:two-component system, NtrC family, sensor kinase